MNGTLLCLVRGKLPKPGFSHFAHFCANADESFPVFRGPAEALGRIQDKRAAVPLLAGLKRRNLRIVAGAHGYFIRHGELGADKLLVEALEKHETQKMAENYLNSDNSTFESAARDWLESQNYIIYSLPIPSRSPR